MLNGSVLPAICMLHLEIGVAVPTAASYADAVMLSDVSVASHPGGILQQQAVVVLFGYDVDDSGYGVAAVKGRRRTLHYLYLLDVLRIDKLEIVVSANVSVKPLSVHHNQDVGISKAVHRDMASHIVLVEIERRGKAGKNVLKASSAVIL